MSEPDGLELMAHQSYLVWWVFLMLAKMAAIAIGVGVGGFIVGLVLVHATGNAGWILLGLVGVAVQPLVFPFVVWGSRAPRMFTDLDAGDRIG